MATDRGSFQHLLAVDVSATGQSAAFDTEMRAGEDLYVSAIMKTLTGGTSPTVDFALQHSGDGTNWVSRDALGAALDDVHPNASSNTGTSITGSLRFVRFTWTTTGGPTAATADLYVHG